MAVRNFRKARVPVRLHEVTPRMLVHVQKDADSSWLAQTVWPSRFIGKDYVGHDCLVISACAGTDNRPCDAFKDSEPLLTVLPSQYLASMILGKEVHDDGWCDAGMCPFHESERAGF